MPTDILLDLSEDTELRELLNIEIPCGGQTHKYGRNGHRAHEKASYAMISPCCGFRVFVCAGRAAWVRANSDVLHCSSCGGDSSALKWSFELI